MAVVRASELTIQEYVQTLDLNPANVFYSRLRSNNVTTAGAQWQITSPNKRSLLLSWAVVDWQPTIRRFRADGTTGQNFDDAGDQFSFKPLMPFTNAMTSQTVSINGNSLTMSQPRRFSEPLCRMAVSKQDSVACYESQWWNGAGGSFATNRAGIDAHAAYIDEGLRQNESSLKGKFLNSRTPAVQTLNGIGGTNLADAVTVSYQEPLWVPPFDAFAKVKAGMPGYMPWKHQSPVIPNIDRIEVDIQFNSDKLAAGSLLYRYAHADTVNEVKNLLIVDLAADLLLYWYEVPVDVSIPRSPVLQSWNIREFQSTVNGAGAVANGVSVVNTTLTDLLQLRSVPSLIVMHARRRQDRAEYKCSSMISDDDFLGTGNAGSANAAGASVANVTHSLDSFMEITSMNVLLGDRPNVISTSFTQRELYQMTVKNSKYSGFSLSFNDWVGPYGTRVVMANTAVNLADNGPIPSGTYEFQQSKCFIAFQPKDLAEKISSGVFFPNSLQIEVNLRARDGAYGLRGGNQIYDLFTHVLIGKHWLRIEPDRAQYQEQNIPFEAAERALKPSLVQSGGSGRGGAYVSRY